MFQNIGFTELLLIAVVALVLFGPQKLPEIGRILGRTIRDFKNAANELMNEDPKPQKVNMPLAPDPVTPVEMATHVALDEEPEAPPIQLTPEKLPADAGGLPEQKPAVSFVTNTSPVVIHVAGKDDRDDASAAQAADSGGAQRTGGTSQSRRLPD